MKPVSPSPWCPWGSEGAWGYPGGHRNEEGSVLRLGCQQDIKAGRCVVLTPYKENSAFSLLGLWDERCETHGPALAADKDFGG